MTRTPVKGAYMVGFSAKEERHIMEIITSLNIATDSGTMSFHLNSGLTLIIPVSLYERLANAEPKELMRFNLIGDGTGVHWPGLDEDLSLKGFLKEFLRQKLFKEKELVISGE